MSQRLVLLFLLAVSLYGKSHIVETDLLKIQKVTEVQLSPDGNFAVYGVLSVHTEPASKPDDPPNYGYRTNLWLKDLRSPASAPVQLTEGDRHDAQLAISPDGSQLAFVRPDAKKHGQIWLLPLRTPGEARQLTTLEYGAANPQWRKDGAALIVASPIPMSKLPGTPTFDQEIPAAPVIPDRSAAGNPDGDVTAIREWLLRNAARDNPSDITRMNFLGELSLAGEMTFSELFRIDLTDRRATQLTTSFRDHSGAIFSPDGSRIVFSGPPESPRHPDRIREQSILWELPAAGGAERPVVTQAEYSLRNPQFTPDGKHLIFIAQQNDQPTYRQTMLGRSNPDGSHLEWLTRDGDPSVSAYDVSEPGQLLYTTGYLGGEPLHRLNLKSGRIEDVITGPVGVNTFAAAAGKLVFAEITATNPNELYQLENGKPRVLTALNSAWLQERELSLPEEHWLTRPDGLKVQYWVMRPVAAAPGKRYPWVLDIHGGPSAMWGPGEFSMWHEFQIFCASGYGVVYSNPRGSSGYGYQFQRANYQNWGEAPMGDVMAVLDETLKNEPSANPDQLFVTGGSYAGYLTAWIIGHSNRFRAAAALRGVYDLSTFFGEGNAYQLVPEEFGGYPWEPATRQLLDAESPISYVADMKTPLLIIHGSSDNRTGVVQGQMLFRALKQLNRPVEYIRYPGAGHEITRSGAPLQRMDHMLRIIEFFDRYRTDQGTGQSAAPTSLK